uniref:TLC domain-containing protein n=1 Tax=Steinernema glaseri TaxID=37863 RepID=A0A1I7Z6Y5_9BILA
MTKLCFYAKKRSNGEYYRTLDILGNVFFVLFGIMWLVFRLYWYPLKFIYTTVYAGVYLAPQDSPFLPVIGLMLLILQLMNIYWFSFIVRMVVRVCRTGEDPEDNREFDTEAVSGIPREQLKLLAEQGQLHSVSAKRKDKET